MCTFDIQLPVLLSPELSNVLHQNWPYKHVGLTISSTPVLNAISQCRSTVAPGHCIPLDTLCSSYETGVFLRIFGTADSSGVFHFHDTRFTKGMCALNPSSMEELILLTALSFHPEGDALLQTAAAAKHSGTMDVNPLSSLPLLADILAPTYGVPVYQEQITQMIQRLSGCSWENAEAYRRRMVRKDKHSCPTPSDFLLCVEANTGIDINQLITVYNYLEKVSRHTFFKSHAAALSALSYQTAWLKYHYPKEYDAARLATFDSLNMI